MSDLGSNARRAKIVHVMRRYHNRMRLHDMPGAILFGRPWRRVDVTLHELAHAFDLRLDPRDRRLRDLNSAALEEMPEPEGHATEFLTHAVARLVLDAYTVPLPWPDQMRDAEENIDPFRTYVAGHIERRVRAKMKTHRAAALAAKLCAFIEQEARQRSKT